MATRMYFACGDSNVLRLWLNYAQNVLTWHEEPFNGSDEFV